MATTGRLITNLLHDINTQHGTTFELLERYPSGEQGAFVIADGSGKRCVLKWEPDAGALSKFQRATAVCEQLRKAGYPAPDYYFVGTIPGGSYAIQEVLPGAPMKVLTAEFLPPLLELNELQIGRGLSEYCEWPRRVIDTVMMGGDGYCVLDSLRSYSSMTADLLTVLQLLVSARVDEEYETHDVVHFDFHPLNILVDGGQVSGVIDWDGTCAGDCAFDLATLLFYSYDAYELRELLM